MKSQTSNNLLNVALLIAVIAVLVVVLWASAQAPALLATVSWNG